MHHPQLQRPSRAYADILSAAVSSKDTEYCTIDIHHFCHIDMYRMRYYYSLFGIETMNIIFHETAQTAAPLMMQHQNNDSAAVNDVCAATLRRMISL